MVTHSRTVLRRYVAGELKRLREEAGLKHADVAKRLHCNRTHIVRWETEHYLPRPTELEVFLDFLGHADRIPAFVELVEATRRGADWFEPFAGTAPAWFDLNVGTESSALSIASYDAQVPSGLGQIPDVTRAIIVACEPDLDEAVADRRIEFRQRRQDVLTRQPNPPLVSWVLDESVLMRPIGGPAVWAAQLEHLLKLTELPTVTLQILPLALGAHPGINGTVKVMRHPPEFVGAPGIAYTEDLPRGHYYDQPDEVEQYSAMLGRLQELALTPEKSRDRVTRQIEELM